MTVKNPLESRRTPSRITYRSASSIHVPPLITKSAQVWSSKLTVPRKGTREGVEKAAAAWAEQLVLNSQTGNFKQLLRHLVQMLARCTSGDIGKGTGEADAADLPAGISSKSLVFKKRIMCYSSCLSFIYFLSFASVRRDVETSGGEPHCTSCCHVPVDMGRKLPMYRHLQICVEAMGGGSLLVLVSGATNQCLAPTQQVQKGSSLFLTHNGLSQLLGICFLCDQQENT